LLLNSFDYGSKFGWLNGNSFGLVHFFVGAQEQKEYFFVGQKSCKVFSTATLTTTKQIY
jgi:hypothetical protein